MDEEEKKKKDNQPVTISLFFPGVTQNAHGHDDDRYDKCYGLTS